ncbi:MAG: hypothetical protein LBH14_08555 [Desulfobulbaceae bacterium]|nr:hypothetical protein [Desulfobulbaceae bacterium]
MAALAVVFWLVWLTAGCGEPAVLWPMADVSDVKVAAATGTGTDVTGADGVDGGFWLVDVIDSFVGGFAFVGNGAGRDSGVAFFAETGAGSTAAGVGAGVSVIDAAAACANGAS